MTKQKWGAVVFYLVLIAAAVMLAPGTATTVIVWFLGVTLIAHVIEFLVKFGVMKQAGGSMAGHFVQTLLFGFMHWRPLEKK